MAHLRGASAGAWDIRRHVEHCRSVEHRGAHQGRFHSPRRFSEARVRRKGPGAHGESTCQSTTATVRPALLHWNFEAALRTASVGVFARLRVIPKTCILHLNFSTSREQSDNALKHNNIVPLKTNDLMNERIKMVLGAAIFAALICSCASERYETTASSGKRD